MNRTLKEAKKRHLIFNLYKTKAYLEDFAEIRGGYPASPDISLKGSLPETSLRLSLDEFVKSLENPFGDRTQLLVLPSIPDSGPPGAILYFPLGRRLSDSLVDSFVLSALGKEGRPIREALRGYMDLSRGDKMSQE